MDKIAEYLSLVEPAYVAAGVGLVIWLVTLIPARMRLPIALAAMPVVLATAKLQELNALATICKVMSGVSFAAVAAAALCHPGPKLRLPALVWLWPIVAFASVYYVMNALDGLMAMVLHAQWGVMALAAVLTARTVTSGPALMTIIYSLFAGLGLSCLATFSQLALDPIAAISAYGRFSPYGCNPNQIALTYALSAGLGLLLSVTSKSVNLRMAALAVTGLATGQAVLSVSRTAILFIAGLCFPSGLRMAKNPIYAAAALLLLLGGVLMLMQNAESQMFERVGDGLSRTHHWTVVLEDVAQRPLTGLMGVTWHYAVNVENNAHNAYVQFLFVGGLSLAVPLFTAQMYGHWCAFRVWKQRGRLPVDPQVITLLAVMSGCQLASGLVNSIIYYPTYAWAFLTVMISALFMGLNASLKAADRAAQRRASTPPPSAAVPRMAA